MADETAAIDRISFLSRSEHRVQILRHLLSAGPTTRYELRQQLDASRSTVTRTLTALEDRGLVTAVGNEYELTPSGGIIADAFGDLIETVQATDDLSTFLEWFPYSENDIDFDDLRAADVTVSTDADPYAPSRKHAQAFGEFDQFRMLLPSIDLELARSVDDRLKNGELELEMVVSPEMEETISTGAFASVLREQIETGNMTILVSEEPVPFYLGLSESTTVQIGVEDDEGFPRAVLEATGRALRTWGEEVYTRYRGGAREKPAAEF